MPRLTCSVNNCIHNNSNYCCMQNIQVDGTNAMRSDNTCCNSFADNTGNMTNAVEDRIPNEVVSVKCEADNCIHNQNCECHAETIDVCGFGANNSQETACASFYCK